MPAYLVVHGGVLSPWIGWLLVQSSLVAASRPELHRRLGVVGVGLAACVAAVTVVTLLGFLRRMQQLGVDVRAEAMPLANFVVLVTLAVVYRRRPEIHKRLMLWASLFVIGAAGTRIPASLAALGLPGIIAPIWLLLVLGCPIAYDFLVRGRPDKVTVVGAALLILTNAATFVLAGNETVQAIVLNLD